MLRIRDPVRSVQRELRLTYNRTWPVLVHSATGDIGHAAIRICRSVGVKVFATTSSKAKVDYLVNTMAVPKGHVFLASDDSVAAGLKRVSNGQGVVIVLNTIPLQKMHSRLKFGQLDQTALSNLCNIIAFS